MRSPFDPELQLATDLDMLSKSEEASKEACDTLSLPGHPNVHTTAKRSLYTFLASEFISKDLEKMAPYLWLMSQQSSRNISPLHRQIVKNRSIVITEDPRLHLVWQGERVFIKPLPAYLLSYQFWTVLLAPQLSNYAEQTVAEISSAALGFLRSYALLIRYESDFILATKGEPRLLPTGVEYERLLRLLDSVDRGVTDDMVSSRYRYGELRLKRLNFYCKFILRQRYFHRTHVQYGTYFAQFYGPVLFMVGCISIFLNAMQVGLSVEEIMEDQSDTFWALCKWFSIMTLSGGALLICLLAALMIYTFAKEWSYAIRDRIRNERARSRACCNALA